MARRRLAQWVVDGYIVAFASLILLAGSLADRIGVRRGFLVGLAVFVVASAACAVANSVAFLIAARVAQGIGAAWLMPCSLALIAHTFAEPHARRRALAVWGAVSGVGLASGPVVGGILVTSVGWRAIFFANVPVGLAAGWLLVLHAEETPRSAPIARRARPGPRDVQPRRPDRRASSTPAGTAGRRG